MGIMNRFFVHPRANAPQLRYEGVELRDVYNSYSAAKAAAYHKCMQLFRECNGTDFRLVSHNSYGFSVAFEFVNPENGRDMVAHITPCYNHAYYIDKVD